MVVWYFSLVTSMFYVALKLNNKFVHIVPCIGVKFKVAGKNELSSEFRGLGSNVSNFVCVQKSDCEFFVQKKSYHFRACFVHLRKFNYIENVSMISRDQWLIEIILTVYLQQIFIKYSLFLKPVIGLSKFQKCLLCKSAPIKLTNV